MSEQALHDWKPDGWEETDRFGFEVILENGGFFEVFGYEEKDGVPHSDAAKEAVDESAAPARVEVAGIDPYVGAGGVGLGIAIEFLDVGADLITWGIAATAIAPRIRQAVASIRQKFQTEDHKAKVSLSGEAIAVLAVADLCGKHGIEPESVLNVEWISHEIDPPEPRMELKRIYATYTVAIESKTEAEGMDVWVYNITSYGKVLSETQHRVPIPNAGHWEFPNRLPGRFLEGLDGHGA